ncbi:hypothetical protein NKDENANG_02762 [Candidatus Entotheonellaceae bacterium PAL068K]
MGGFFEEIPGAIVGVEPGLYPGIMEGVLRLLDATTQRVVSVTPLHPLLNKIMETTTAILDAERGTLFPYDDRTNELWSQVAHGAEINEIRLPTRAGIAANVFTSGETLNSPDAYMRAPGSTRTLIKKPGIVPDPFCACP